MFVCYYHYTCIFHSYFVIIITHAYFIHISQCSVGTFMVRWDTFIANCAQSVSEKILKIGH